MNLDFSPEDAAFREEARTFIAQNYPKELREKQDRGEELSKEKMAGFAAGLNLPAGLKLPF